jgi:hypothetical protein
MRQVHRPTPTDNLPWPDRARIRLITWAVAGLSEQGYIRWVHWQPRRPRP